MHGPDSVAFYVSGQLLTEDYYAFNKLARALVGTNNIDSNSRLCMSSAVAGYKATLGADGPPGCYDDIEHADCILIAGSNAAWAHPVLFRRIEDAKRARPDLKVIVVDPRRTATAEIADQHLAILPGTDVALFNGMLHVLLWEEMTDAAFIDAHTEGFAALKATLRDYTPKFAAELCGIREDEVIAAARAFGRAKAALSLYCMGLNQSASGTDKNAALINLHLATGQIGRAGAGPFSLTGQPNAMGGRETGSMANLLPAHRDPAVPADRAELARLWGVASLPANPGKTAVEMFEAMRKGEIKAVWIACTNPAQSLPAQSQVRAALERAELVVLQEAFSGTETAPYADVLLPAASWGEKDGTVTNSERRISRVRAAVRAPGEARADWAITVDFARRLEARLRPGCRVAVCVRVAAGHLRRVPRFDARPRDRHQRAVLRVARTRRTAAMAVARRRRHRARAPLRRRPVSDRERPRALRRYGIPPGRGKSRRALSVSPDHRALARPMARDEPHRPQRAPVRPHARAAGRAAPVRPRAALAAAG